MTAWKDKARLIEFVKSEVHQKAVQAHTGNLSDGLLAHVEMPSHQISLSWKEAEALLQKHSRSYA